MYHFISGLPRSGSTLLASILRQNPKIHASIMSPVGHIVTNTLHAMGVSNEAEGYLTDDQKASILRGVFHGYYGTCPNEFIFDNNRRWTANIGLIAELFPDSKVVCCVRSPAVIADSLERLFQSAPLSLSLIHGANSNTTVYERVFEFMKPSGVLGFALNALRTAFFGPFRDRLLFVPYDDLARWPAAIMEDLTAQLHLPPHNYNFKQIEPIPGAKAFDLNIGTPGLHDLLPEVVYDERPSVLPPDIFKSLPTPFWVKDEVTHTA